MPELESRSDTDMTARLVDQLTRTNERLERLEAALRERSLLPAIQQEPAQRDAAAFPSSLLPGGADVAAGDNNDMAARDTAKEAEADFRRGVALCQAGKFDDALAAWQQVLRVQPDNPYALANTGIVYTEQGRWSEARDMFIRVLGLQPENAEAHYGLGMADAQLGNYPGAVAAWENTLRLQPGNTDARYNLALIRQRLAQSGARASAGSAPQRGPEQMAAPVAYAPPPPTSVRPAEPEPEAASIVASAPQPTEPASTVASPAQFVEPTGPITPAQQQIEAAPTVASAAQPAEAAVAAAEEVRAGLPKPIAAAGGRRIPIPEPNAPAAKLQPPATSQEAARLDAAPHAEPIEQPVPNRAEEPEVAPLESAAAPARDWKRVEEGGRPNYPHTKPGRAARPERPAGMKANRSPLPAIVVIGAALVAIVLFNNFRPKASQGSSGQNAAGFASRPAPASVAPKATAGPKGESADSRAGAATNSADASGGAPGPAFPAGAPPPANGAGPAFDAGVGAPTLDLTRAADPNPEMRAAGGGGAPGRMQVRLGAGVTGRFRYWFVSNSDRAARMKPLPSPGPGSAISLPIPAEYNQRGAQLRILNTNTGKVAHVGVVDISRTRSVISPNVGVNLLQNADFTHAVIGWRFEVTPPARGSMRILDSLGIPPGVAGRGAHFDVAATGAQAWSVQFLQPGVNLADRTPYLLSFWAKASRNRPLHLDVIMDKPPWNRIGVIPGVTASQQWRKYMLPFTVAGAQPSHSQISLILGEYTGSVEIAGLTLRRTLGRDMVGSMGANTVVTIRPSDFN
jgi:tetratricopeptide (TPR) repeat protein